jgi:hypothetical protein
VTRLHLNLIGPVVADPGSSRVYAVKDYDTALILDAVIHAELGTIAKLGHLLRLNPLIGRLYGVTSLSPGYVLRIADTTSGRLVGGVYLDGDVRNFDVHGQLGKLFLAHETWPTAFAKKMTIIQDESPSGPAPIPPPPAAIGTGGGECAHPWKMGRNTGPAFSVKTLNTASPSGSAYVTATSSPGLTSHPTVPKSQPQAPWAGLTVPRIRV